MTKVVLQFEQVEKQYRLGETIITAVQGISLSFRAGEFAALVGPSGSGKSTLLHLGAGLDRPTKGVVSLVGKEIQKMKDEELALIRNEQVGFIFQTFNLIPVLTVQENVEYPSLLYPRSRKNRSRARELLELVGLSDHAKKRPTMLSGGQRQRVAIARALVNNPSIVFADEPTANLDHATGELIMSLLQRLNRELGVTFIFSTHDPRIMEKAHRIVRLEDGRIVADSGMVNGGEQRL
ncbi:MAG: ABC transporter ATP-binding protein [Treponemataceae bacterium]|nr:ABC transporter ATP-binding protein [Treponemataceae bacterium]